MVQNTGFCITSELFVIQVKAFCAGGNLLGEVSLFQKIVAALITGE